MRGARGRRAIPFAIALLTFLVFSPALSADFVSWDDERNFLTNPHYRGLGLDQLRWMWSTTLLGHYVPLSWMTLGLDYALWGMNPTGYHLTNLLIHCANAVVLFFLARRLLAISDGGQRADDALDTVMPAAFAALVFAIHPLRVESVAWITERRDVLSQLFYLLTIRYYLVAATTAGNPRRPYWIAFFLFCCALLSKGTSVTVPAVLLILNVYPLRRLGGRAGWWTESARRVFADVLPFGVPALAFALLSVIALRPPEQLPLSGKLAVTAYGFAFYLWKTIVPTGLSPLYGMPTRVDPLASRFIVAYAVSAVVVALSLALRRRWPAFTTLIVAFVVISLPMLGIVQNGPQIAADRYTYHAAPALALLAMAGLIVLRRSLSSSATLTLAAVVLIPLAALTWRQTFVWKDSERLWNRVLEIEPSSPMGHSARANILFKQNRVEEAIAHSMRAVEAAPNFAEGHNDLGVGLARTGQPLAAIERYRMALSLRPDHDEAENNWGVVMAQMGQADSALAHYRRALASNPDNPDVHVNWGNVLVRAGRPAEAIEHYQRAVWIRPDHADAELNWGVALARDGRMNEAITHFERALAIDPAHVEARAYLEQARRLR
ncbi:MAG TPA: tetratricopeptide repeat protein [Gemmatimonadaceae bacterium]|nr:tetratricopeptide repeat protein [Gemmatimonadaceae bacterium]